MHNIKKEEKGDIFGDTKNVVSCNLSLFISSSYCRSLVVVLLSMDQELEQQKATIVSLGSTLHDNDHVAPTQPPPPPPQQMPASPQQEARTASRSSSTTSLNVSNLKVKPVT